jgi:cyanophycin synthetase
MMKLFIVVSVLFVYCICLWYTNSYKKVDRVEIRSVKYFNGPNEWNYVPSIEVILDIKEFENYPSDKIPHLYDSLVKTLPSIFHHRCSPGYKGGFLERVKDGTYFGHILEHLALELQNFTGVSKGMGRTRQTDEYGVYKIILSAGNHSRESVLECFYCALDLLLAIIDRHPIDIVEYQTRILEKSQKVNFGSNMLEIIYCLKHYNIPYFKLNEGSFIQVGYGNKQKRLWITTTGNSSGISESIASDKTLTKRLLSQQGIPVPEGDIVTSEQEAIDCAARIGYPVVVKPRNGNHADGVTLNIRTKQEVINAFPSALLYNKNGQTSVIVEKYITGDSYRVTLVNNRVIAVCRHIFKTIPVSVRGDGSTTLIRLIDNIRAQFMLEDSHTDYSNYSDTLVNYHDSFFKKERLDKFLRENLYDKSDILLDAQTLSIDLVYDGYNDIDQSTLSPSIRKSCEQSTQLIGMDICGIDLVSTSITDPDASYAIIEMNAGPDLRVHRNTRYNTGHAIIEYMFNMSTSSYFFPLLGITGYGDRAGVNHFITLFFRNKGITVGSVGEGGCSVGDRSIGSSADNITTSIKNILSNVTVEMAVIDNSIEQIHQEGLAYRYANSIILGNIIETNFRITRTQLDIVRKGGSVILNRNDPNLAMMTDVVDETEQIIFYSIDDQSTLRQTDKIVYYDNQKDAILIKNSNETVVLYDKPVKNLDVILPAIAGIWSMDDLMIHDNRAGLVEMIESYR